MRISSLCTEIINDSTKIHKTLNMERITLFVRTTKKDGPIKLRFHLRDGESVQLYHKSDIIADQKYLEKFNLDGTVKGRIQLYNKDLKEITLFHITENQLYGIFVLLCAPHSSTYTHIEFYRTLHRWSMRRYATPFHLDRTTGSPVSVHGLSAKP